MAETVISVLKKLANSGAIVICTIHQPSIEVFSHMDSVCLLALGKVIYMGAVSQLDGKSI